MKVLSKYLKVALCFMAFALCSFMFAFSPTLTAVQAAEMAITGYNVAINALKMPTEVVNYENGDVFEVPLLASSMGTKTPERYTIKVVDPAGYTHNCNIKYDNVTDPSNPKYVIDTTKTDKVTDTDTSFFDKIEDGKLVVNAKNDGDYKIIYVVTEGGKTYYSNTYHVTVENVSYELDFSTPVLNNEKEIVGYTKNIMPTKMDVSTEKFELPVAYAKIAGKDFEINQADGSISNDVATIKVTKDGAPQKLDDTENPTVFTSDAGKFYITPSEEGVYTVEYIYENSANRPTKTFTINVENNYVAGALKLASTPTMPKFELGKTITLPKITVNAGDETNVDVNVESIVIEKENSNGAIACTLTNNNFEFVMSPENFTGVDNYEDMVGNYRITYVVKGYGKNQTLTETFKVDNVTVSSKPTIKLSYNYDTTQSNYAENVVLGAETELKAEYLADGEIVLPAAYVEDAVTTNFDDFIIVRAIRKGSTYYYIDNYKYDEDAKNGISYDIADKYKNALLADDEYGDPTKAIKFKFHEDVTSKEGTYYLEYKVISREVKTRENDVYIDGTTTKYSFKVVSSTSLQEYKKPTVEITNLKNSSVKNSEEITVKVTATDELDTRLKSAVFTHRGTTEVTENGLSTFEDYLAFVLDNLSKTVGVTNKTCHLLDDERLITGWTGYKYNEEGEIVYESDEPVEVEYKGLQDYFNDIKKINENETKNNFDLDLSKYENGYVNVIAVALNDGGFVGSSTKVLTIKDTTDSVAPTITIQSAGSFTVLQDDDGELVATNRLDDSCVFGQGKTITLPEVYITDYAKFDDDQSKYIGGDETLSLNVMYYIDSPENDHGAINYLSPMGKSFGYKTVDGKLVQVIKGGSIVTSQTGTYYVAYTATDVAGNTSVMYFTFEVEDTSKPILSVNPVADDVTISGNTVTGGKGTIVDFEATLKSADGKNDYTSYENVSIEIEDNGKGLDYAPSGNSRTSYVFNSYGTYIVTIGGSYDGRDADAKIIKVVIEKQPIEWVGEFDVSSYAPMNDYVKLPDVAASNGATVKVTYVIPGDSTSEAKDAEKLTDDNGYTYWSFKTNESTKGTYKVIYTATTEDDVLTKTFNVKVGDNVAPTLSFNSGDLTQNYIYNGETDIEYVLEVNKSAKTFVVKVVNNGEEIVAHNIGLVISDKDDNGQPNNNMSWTNLSYELTGDKVTKGDTTTNGNVTKTQYLIRGTGSYSLKLTMKDSYDNERTAEIDFKVVEKSEVKENKDNVVGAVLIVVSLVLLAGVILFFTFTGKKGKKSTKAKKEKVAKTKKVESNNESNVEKEEVTEEKQEEVSEETVEEAKVETVEEPEVIEEVKSEEVVETKEDEEPKTGDVE